MRRRVIASVFVVLLIGIGAGASSQAAPSCVDYSVTAPFVGTRSGRRCVPLPNAFDFPLSIHNCQGVPPAGVTVCAGADLNLLLP